MLPPSISTVVVESGEHRVTLLSDSKGVLWVQYGKVGDEAYKALPLLVFAELVDRYGEDHL